MSQLTMFQAKTQTTPTAPPRQLPGCTLIYQPAGRAREYAALALNIYSGCDHGCTYCYAPSATHRKAEQFYRSTPRADLLTRLEKEAAKYRDANIRARVLLSFTCDPYQRLDEQLKLTRRAIQILHRGGLHVTVLTKGGRRALRDLDLFTPQDAFATTITFLDAIQSQQWEPHAALPDDRISAIAAYHAAGIPTWVSLEPVISPPDSLAAIPRLAPITDVFKVGKLNYHPIAKTISWPGFASSAVEVLETLGYRRNLDPDALESGDYYIKRDLAAYLSSTAR